MPAETRQRDDAGQAGAWLVAGRSGAEASAFTPPGAARRRPARVISLPHVLCGRLLDVSARLPAVELGRVPKSSPETFPWRSGHGGRRADDGARSAHGAAVEEDRGVPRWRAGCRAAREGRPQLLRGGVVVAPDGV